MKKKIIFGLLLALLVTGVSTAQEVVKIGMIGLDTSHSTSFTKFLNSDDKDERFNGFRIVAAYPHGSRTIKSSYDRIPGYTEQVKALGVKIVDSIGELLEQVDVVLLETNDGNMHLEQAYEVFKAGKTVFIDKPLGASLAQSIAVMELARKYDVPVFSASSLRYSSQIQKIRKGEYGKVRGADCYSPHHPEPSHPDFGWYGIHGVEMLYTVMGTGCVAVNRMAADSTDVVVGRWDDGRIGTFRGYQQGRSVYGGTAFTDKGVIPVGEYEGYGPLLEEILAFFKSGVSPVSAEETLEIFTFMEASNESVRHGGKIVSLAETRKRGEREAQNLLRKLK